MKIGIAWDFVSAVTHQTGIVINPRCPAILNDGAPCDLPATVRRTGPRLRSTFWCPIHVFPQTRDWAQYWSRFPDAINRSFVNWMRFR